MLNFNHLYYFYLVGKLGGVSVAARSLRLSQPSLSTQLKTFENANNAKLFRKEGRRLVLTEVGRYLHGYCSKMFDDAAEIENFLRRGRVLEREAARIAFGVCTDVDRRFAVDLMGATLREPGNVPFRVTMVSGAHENLLDQLKARSLDVVLSHRGVSHPDLAIFCQTRSPVTLLVSRKVYKRLMHEKRRWPLPLKILLEIADTAWAAPSPFLELRRETDLFLGRVKIDPLVRFESDMLTAVARAVADDLGLALLPRCYVHREIEDGRIFEVPIREKLWSHAFVLLTRKASGVSVPMERLSKRLKALSEETALSHR